MEKNGAPASPAMARARSVLPVPGAPTRSTPFGMRPPSRWNFLGSFKNAMISSHSSLASSMPATSAKVTRFCDSFRSRARDLPKLMALPPEDWSWRMKKKNTATSSTMGSQVTSKLVQRPVCSSGTYCSESTFAEEFLCELLAEDAVCDLLRAPAGLVAPEPEGDLGTVLVRAHFDLVDLAIAGLGDKGAERNALRLLGVLRNRPDGEAERNEEHPKQDCFLALSQTNLRIPDCAGSPNASER
jgi:hypothetical protein